MGCCGVFSAVSIRAGCLGEEILGFLCYLRVFLILLCARGLFLAALPVGLACSATHQSKMSSDHGTH